MSELELYPPILVDLVKECEDRFPDSGWISIDQFLSDQAHRDWVIADVRELEEREVSIIPGAVPIEDCIEELDHIQEKPILIYCTVGCRSGMCTESLREDGYEVYNLWGGILAWAYHGGPFIDPQGVETRRVHVYDSKWDILPEGYEGIW